MRWLALAAVALLLAGCGGSSDTGAVKKTAVDFYNALSSGNGAKACSLLTPREAQAGGGGGGASGTPSCASGLSAVGRGFPPAKFKSAKVKGDTATATLTTQNGLPIQLTLKKVGGKWRVDRFM